jgi:hypothetical protein
LEVKLSEEIIQNSNKKYSDVYNALTDRDTLNKVLEQGLDGEEYQRQELK